MCVYIYIYIYTYIYIYIYIYIYMVDSLRGGARVCVRPPRSACGPQFEEWPHAVYTKILHKLRSFGPLGQIPWGAAVIPSPPREQRSASAG